jgi:hypothetical protein
LVWLEILIIIIQIKKSGVQFETIKERLMNPIIPVFISSPGDVPEERKLTEEAINMLSQKLSDKFGVALVPLSWRQFAPISSSENRPPQSEILRKLEVSSIFVGIMFRRYGSSVEDKKVSGTELEYDYAIRNRNRIKILSYFRDQDRKNLGGPTDEDIRQLNEVNAFKDRLRSRRVYYQVYQTVEEFSKRILADLMEAVLEIVLAPDPRTSVYRQFFRFGGDVGQYDDRVLITYPPITVVHPALGKTGVNWKNHLLPAVVYEDVKSIQKIERIMRLLGRRYLVVTTPWPGVSPAEQGDRIWVCAPRNPFALQTLRNLGDRVRFRYTVVGPSQNKFEDRNLFWRSRTGKEIKVTSPLFKYLKVARRPAKKMDWNVDFAFTFARDYAILARFQVTTGGRKYYHYFLGGLRGLGTWGAAWYIEHSADQPAENTLDGNSRFAGTSDLQFLLEVDYLNYRIQAVRDVSDLESDYFERQLSDEYVEETFKSNSEQGLVP